MRSDRIWSAFKTMLVAPMDEERVYYECRQCGTSLDGEFAECPYCGIVDVARYEIVDQK